MRKWIILSIVMAILSLGSAPVHALFAPNDAWNFGAGVGYLMTSDPDSGKIAYEGRVEVPAMGLLEFLSVIPGFAFRVGVGYDTDLFFDVATMVRLQPVTPVMVNVGGGVGYNLGVSSYFPLVAGITVNIRKNVALISKVSFLLGGKDELESAIRITGGVAISGQYEN
jgi:hypothetical protein